MEPWDVSVLSCFKVGELVKLRDCVYTTTLPCVACYDPTEKTLMLTSDPTQETHTPIRLDLGIHIFSFKSDYFDQVNESTPSFTRTSPGSSETRSLKV